MLAGIKKDRGFRGAFCPDGRRVLAFEKNHLKLWNLDTGAALQSFEVKSHDCRCLAFAPAREEVLVAGLDERLRVFDVRTGKEQRRSPRHAGPLATLAVGPDGRTAVSVDDRDVIAVWDMHTLEKRWSWRTPGRVHAVALSPDGQLLATGNGNGSIYLIRLPQQGER